MRRGSIDQLLLLVAMPTRALLRDGKEWNYEGYKTRNPKTPKNDLSNHWANLLPCKPCTLVDHVFYDSWICW